LGQGNKQTRTHLLGKGQGGVGISDRLSNPTRPQVQTGPPRGDTDSPPPVITEPDVREILGEERFSFVELANGGQQAGQALPGMHGSVGEASTSGSSDGGAQQQNRVGHPSFSPGQ
jgi:hypothetical protein